MSFIAAFGPAEAGLAAPPPDAQLPPLLGEQGLSAAIPEVRPWQQIVLVGLMALGLSGCKPPNINFGPTHSPTPPAYDLSCAGFGPNVLRPPSGNVDGISDPGIALDGRQVSTAGMTLDSDYGKVDGKPVRVGQSGTIDTVAGKLAVHTTLPTSYRTALEQSLQTPTIRFGICQLTGGLVLSRVSISGYSNGDYETPEDTARLIFSAGVPDQHFRNERQVAYTELHETGHAARYRLLQNNNDPRAISLIHELDQLYAETARIAVAEFAATHGPQISADMEKLLTQFEALPRYIADDANRQKFRDAVAYVQHSLRNPANFAKLAVSPTPFDGQLGHNMMYLNNMDEIFSQASIALVGEQNALYGVSDFILQFPDMLDVHLEGRTDAGILAAVQQAFFTEHVLTGNDSGHPYDSSDESFASLWTITGTASPSKYPRLVRMVPVKYRSLALQELQVMQALREHITLSELSRPRLPRVSPTHSVQPTAP